MKTVDATTRISLKSILLATDFSPVSDLALRYAKRIACRYGAKLFVTHVVSPGEGPTVPPRVMGCLPASSWMRQPGTKWRKLCLRN